MTVNRRGINRERAVQPFIERADQELIDDTAILFGLAVRHDFPFPEIDVDPHVALRDI